VRQQPPGTPRAQPVQHGVDQFPAVVDGGAAARLGRRDQRRQKRPLPVGEVGRVAATRRVTLTLLAGQQIQYSTAAYTLFRHPLEGMIDHVIGVDDTGGHLELGNLKPAGSKWDTVTPVAGCRP
jgi:hypothetical protein